MRVLNRIVRITDGGLLYEADPRHAEMLIKSLNLEDAKSVVTPGIKPPTDSYDIDKIDTDALEAIRQIVAELLCRRTKPSRLQFSNDVVHHHVTPYSVIYGRHPRTFNFDAKGRMIHSQQRNNVETSDDIKHDPCTLSPNARRSILEKVLRNGAAWETSSHELIAKVGKASKNKFAKARLRSKAAKHAERLETAGEERHGESATMYRALSARLLSLSMDRPEVAFAAKELCRHFAHPTQTGVEALKGAVRFLLGLPRLVWAFPIQDHTRSLNVFVDTDFGGCQTTRRSTSRGVAMRGLHPIKHWSTTQTTIALSSGEAELAGICRGASNALGLQSLASDSGITLDIEIRTDATAAIGICRRRGLGKIRHLHVADLWIQDRLQRKNFTLTKVPGAENPADILMKHMRFVGLRTEGGRAASAPTLQHS